MRRFHEEAQARFVRVVSFEYLVNTYQLDPGGKKKQRPGDVNDVYPEKGGVACVVFEREEPENERKT